MLTDSAMLSLMLLTFVNVIYVNRQCYVITDAAYIR